MLSLQSIKALYIFGLLLTVAQFFGCVQHGPVIAQNCSIAAGASQTLNISPGLRASVGDSAINAAQEAFNSYLRGIEGAALTAAQASKEAKAKTIVAAEKAKGEPLSIEERVELENTLESEISNKVECK